MRLLPKIKDLLQVDVSQLAQSKRETRSVIVALLEQESKALKWYKEPAKAYFRCRARIIEKALENNTVSSELEILKDTLYARPSEQGVPLPFLEAMDHENGSRRIKGSSDTPIEL